jgi:predicted nucleic acid-binding protein
VRATDRFLGDDEEARENLGRLFSRVRFVEITPRTVELLYRNPPRGLRTLDAVHLATLAHIRASVGHLAVATYDRRLATAAHAMGFQVIVP